MLKYFSSIYEYIYIYIFIKFFKNKIFTIDIL